MKIRSLGGSAPKLPAIERATRARAPTVRGGRPDEAAARPAQVGGEIATRLRAGEIAPREAISMLVDETVGRLQGASPALRRQVRAALEKIAGDDPGLLAALQRARSGRP